MYVVLCNNKCKFYFRGPLVVLSKCEKVKRKAVRNADSAYLVVWRSSIEKADNNKHQKREQSAPKYNIKKRKLFIQYCRLDFSIF